MTSHDRELHVAEPTDGSLAVSRRRRARTSIALAIAGVALVAIGMLLGRLIWARQAVYEVQGQPQGSAAQSSSSVLSQQNSEIPNGVVEHPGTSHDDLASKLDAVRAATSKYRDVSVAQAEGFRFVVRELPGMGAHFVQVSNARSTTFDPTRPNMLLYKQKSGGWELLAVGYIVSKESFPQPPEYFPGAHWHSHQSLCIFSSGSVGLMPEDECRSKGGYWIDDTGWMLHVWLYAENPSGIFSELNPAV
jgi:hypothetical protein